MSSTSIPLPPGIDATRMSQTSEVPLQTAIFHTVMLVGAPIDGASTSNSTKSMVSGFSETDAPGRKWSAALELGIGRCQYTQTQPRSDRKTHSLFSRIAISAPPPPHDPPQELLTAKNPWDLTGLKATREN